ncbi:MAG: ABC transporter ATP-binding protein [Parasporobacterium sp.]|nr:ABC transporter ATP-binding protein [Parasporobacterium sp.]
MALLEVKDLQVYYGVIQALKGISFKVEEGQIVTLIGANGVGKTTTMQTIVGLIPSKAGSIFYEGKEITKLPSHKIVNQGLTQVPEGRRIFQELTVYDNLMLGAYLEKDMKKIKDRIEEVFDQFPILKKRRTQIAGTLSGGEQQMLAMSRALMANPKLLMLDEPSMGLSPLLVNQVFDLITDMNSRGITILLVEQNAEKALAIADQAYVLANGMITHSGTGAELAGSEEIKKAYLGG